MYLFVILFIQLYYFIYYLWTLHTHITLPFLW